MLIRDATRLEFGNFCPSYGERLSAAGFQDRRLRGDLSICFRIKHDLLNFDLSGMIQLDQNNLRGHPLKLYKENYQRRHADVPL